MTALREKIRKFLRDGLVYAARTAAMREGMPWDERPWPIGPEARAGHNETLLPDETTVPLLLRDDGGVVKSRNKAA